MVTRRELLGALGISFAAWQAGVMPARSQDKTKDAPRLETVTLEISGMT